MVAEVHAATDLEQMAALVPEWRLEWHDARTLLTDRNVRKAQPDADLIASVGTSGVLQPIVAVRTAEGQSVFLTREGEGEPAMATAEGKTRVRYGESRTMAAIISENYLVPVIVTGPEGDDKAEEIARIINQRSENTYRQGMKDSEHADAAYQLSLLGVSETDIAEGLRMQKTQVRAAKKLAKTEGGAAMLDEHEDLDILTAAKIAEFEDDPERVRSLLIRHRTGGGLDSLIRHYKDLDKRAATVAKVKAALESQGLTVTEARASWDRYNEARYVTALKDENGDGISVDQHTECPGHAFIVKEVPYYKAPDGTLTSDLDMLPADERDGAEPVEGRYEGVAVCTQHIECHPGPVRQLTEADRTAAEEAERREAERKEAASHDRSRVMKGNKEWDAAVSRRRAFVKKELVSRMTPPPGAVEYLTKELLVSQYALCDSFKDGHPLAADWLGVAADSSAQYSGDSRIAPRRSALEQLADEVSDKRRQVLLLTVVLAANEKALNRQSWRNKDGCGQKNYLRFLIARGYDACGTERLAAGLPELAEEPADDATPAETDAA
ncbi:hypothetical protein ACQPXM_41425 (plasmid) [Kribbella sp. CA-253562]|uniref:hypothetical protein n=1 Tax=Kribbella sp. CA-253562 TaxID=3239942 RepID=UPI003D8E6951